VDDSIPGNALSNTRYDVTARPWYKAVKAAGAPMWSVLSTFASSTSSTVYVGFTLGVPYYEKQGTKLVGVIATDINANSYFQPLIDAYKEAGVQAYMVESSTYYLIVSTTGESCFNYNTRLIKKATASLDAVTAGSASYLTNSNTGWRSDGDYVMTIGDVNYNVNLRSYVDATGTAMWKIVVVGELVDTTVQSSDYNQTAQEAMTSTKASINNIWAIAMDISPVIVFQHGASDIFPLSTPVMTFSTPGEQSLTQQALWATASAFNKNVGSMIVRICIIDMCSCLY
jgi:hypothetical protein